MIKLKDFIGEAESVHGEPPEIKKRLGGRYGGEPEKAVADPGNLTKEDKGDFGDSDIQGVVNDDPLKFAVDPIEEGVSPTELIRAIEAEIKHGQGKGWNAHKIVSMALHNLKSDPEHYNQQQQQQEFSARPGGGGGEDAKSLGQVVGAASTFLLPKPVMEKVVRKLTERGWDKDAIRRALGSNSQSAGTPIKEIGHKHKKWEPGQPFPKEVSRLIQKFTSNDKAAIRELSPQGDAHGLKFNKPKNGIWAYVWRLAKFRSGVDPRTPMRADWDLSDEIEKETGWRVNFYAGDDPAQKAILKALDGQVNRVVKELGLDPQGAARRWGRALGTPGSEGSGGAEDLTPQDEPEEKPKKKEKETEKR